MNSDKNGEKKGVKIEGDGILHDGGPRNIDNTQNSAYNSDVEFVTDDSQEATEAKIKRLRKKLEQCMAERQEYLAGWQRAKADFINARGEEEKSRAYAKARAREDLILELLPVLDSFNLSRADSEAWNQVPENWRVGVEYIHAQLQNALAAHGLREVPAEGQPFKPEVHIPIEAVPTPDKTKNDIVAEVVQRGYEVRGKVIRPATVKVWSFKN